MSAVDLGILAALVVLLVAWGWWGWTEAYRHQDRVSDLEGEIEVYEELLGEIDCG